MGYTGAGSNVPLQLVADLSGMADKPTQDKILEILLGDFGGTNTPDDGTDNVFLTIKNILSNLQTDINTVKNAIGEGNLTFDQAQNIKDTLQNAGITLPEDASMQDILSALDNSIINKDTLKNTLTSLGVSVSDTDTIPDLLAKINNIITLDKGTADATAVAGQMLAGTTAYVNGKKVTGTIPSLDDNRIIPGTADKVISAGNYLAGAQTIAGDANLIPANIAKGKSIFGVTGAFTGGNQFVKQINITDHTIAREDILLPWHPSVIMMVLNLYKSVNSPITDDTPPVASCITLSVNNCVPSNISNGDHFIVIPTYDNSRANLYVYPTVSNNHYVKFNKISNSNNYDVYVNPHFDSNMPSNIQKYVAYDLYLVALKY